MTSRLVRWLIPLVGLIGLAVACLKAAWNWFGDDMRDEAEVDRTGDILLGTPGLLPHDVRRHLGVDERGMIEFELEPAQTARVRAAQDVPAGTDVP